MRGVALCALLLSGVAHTPHPDSLSRTSIEISGGSARVRLRFQVLSLIEAIDGLDVDDNLELSAQEAEAGRERIEAYFVDRLRFLVPSPVGAADLLDGRLEDYSFLPEALLGPAFLPWMEVQLTYRNPAGALERFDLESLFFRESNPLHADVTSVTYAGEAPVEYFFSRLDLRHHIVAPRLRRPLVLRAFMRTGTERALHLETLGMLLALLAAAIATGGTGRLMGIFMLAQMGAYFVGAFGWIDFPERIVALAAALGVAYIGVENVVSPGRGGVRWEAAGFGLLLGANLVGDFETALQGESLTAAAGMGYGLGFQLASVLVIALLSLLIQWGRGKVDPAKLARGLSAVAIVVGLLLFLQRAGWFS